jgi:hypothetical protein
MHLAEVLDHEGAKRREITTPQTARGAGEHEVREG